MGGIGGWEKRGGQYEVGIKGRQGGEGGVRERVNEEGKRGRERRGGERKGRGEGRGEEGERRRGERKGRGR